MPGNLNQMNTTPTRRQDVQRKSFAHNKFIESTVNTTFTFKSRKFSVVFCVFETLPLADPHLFKRWGPPNLSCLLVRC